MSNQAAQATQPPCSLEHLKARCEESGECWEWKATFRAGKWPVIAFRRDWAGDGSRSAKQFYVRHLMYWHKRGNPPVLGNNRALIPKCGNRECVNPDHLMIVSRAELSRRVAAKGHYKSLTRRMNLSAARLKTSKLSADAVAEIRGSDAKATAMAEKHGISVTYVYMLKKGQWRKDYSNPFAGLMG